MFNLVVIGAGSLGSCFAIEAARRASASKRPLSITIVDFDTVEDRNVYSQDFYPSHIGDYKSKVVAEICNQYQGVSANGVVGKFSTDNHEIVESEGALIVDCVDSIATRQDIWVYCKARDLPCLHLGMSKKGFGLVEWSYKTYDTFSLSPAHGVSSINPEEDEKLPPCQLNSMRPLIVKTALCGVWSAFVFMGHDPNDLIVDEEGTNLCCPGITLNWYVELMPGKIDENLTTIMELV